MFNLRLKEARTQAGLTQQKAAELLNLSTRSYQRYEAETGKMEPSLETLVAMADLMDISIDWLLGRDDFLAKHAGEY